MYMDGGYTEENYKALREAADKGVPDAMYELGMLWVILAYNNNDNERVLAGFGMLEDAIAKGSGVAATYLGTIYQDGKYGVSCDMVKAVEYYKIGAELGDSQAMSNYGIALQRGDGNLKQDDAEAFKWLKKAADSDSENGIAHYNVALAYHAGRGVRIDRQQAKLYFQNAAKCGIGMAEIWLYSEDYKQ